MTLPAQKLARLEPMQKALHEILLYLKDRSGLDPKQSQQLDELIERSSRSLPAEEANRLAREVQAFLFKLEFAAQQEGQDRENILRRLTRSLIELALEDSENNDAPHEGKLHQLADRLMTERTPEGIEAIRQEALQLVLQSISSRQDFQAKYEQQTRSIILELLDSLTPGEEQANPLTAEIAEIREIVKSGCDVYALSHVQRRLNYLLEEYRNYRRHQQRERHELLKIITLLSDTLQAFQSGNDTFLVGIQDYLEKLTAAKGFQQFDDLRTALIKSTEEMLDRARSSAEKSRELHKRLLTAQSRVLVLEEELERLKQRLSSALEERNIDPLTALPNRRALAENLAAAFETFVRHRSVHCISLIDIDFFKRVNDQYGHAAGDEVLRRVAAHIKKLLRKTDFAARYGGEEFALLLPNTTARGAFLLLERLRHTIAVMPVAIDGTTTVSVTISAGLCELEPGLSTDEWLKKADAALYAAKHNGRDQVRIANQNAF